MIRKIIPRGWKFETARMAMYIFYPIWMFHVITVPEFYGLGWLMKKHEDHIKEMFEDHNKEVNTEYMRKREELFDKDLRAAYAEVRQKFEEDGGIVTPENEEDQLVSEFSGSDSRKRSPLS